MNIDKRLIFHLDWTLLGLVLLICLVGLVNIYSASYSLPVTNLSHEPLYLKQFRWIIVGLLAMILAFLIDYRLINRYAYLIYAASLVLLIWVLLFGKVAQGAQRWLTIGGLTFQPSEFMKIAIILALARYFEEHRTQGLYRLRDLFIPMLMVLIPFLLILRQPDLGTAMMILLIVIPTILLMGIEYKSLIAGCLSCLVIIPIGWMFLKDYQKERLITFLNPEHDPLGAGYHIIQSMIAVGSGWITGKGFLKGSQTQLKFLPEQQTDFIFSVLAEEWGFIGGFTVIFLFLVIISWGFRIAYNSRDVLGTIIAFGVTVMLAGGVIINIGMVLGIFPVVGVPLPFLSYGGSATVVGMIGVGLLMNISFRRFIFSKL